MTRARWAALVIALLMILYAVQGGEYSTLNLLTLRRQERDERAKVAALTQVVDSLEKAAKAIEHDPRVQERMARERFGMIGRGEMLYRLVPDSASGSRPLDPSATQH